MKKLVKTAKQQFEDDLNNLTLVRTWKMCDSEIYHHCVNEAGHFILFREQDEEYKILMYHKTYEELVLSEEFLFSVTQRFIDGRAEIKQLYNWYASADHEDEPFNLLDVYMSELEAVDNTYEDEYEEVPDVRIITAKEQWEEASKNARKIPSHKGCTCKFEETEEGLSFYIYDYNSYESYHFPSFDELRKDGNFVSVYIGIVQKLHPEDLAYAIQWLADGKYNMADVTLWDIKEALEGCEDEHIFFVDKEVPQRKCIEQLLALTPEQQEAVKMIEEGCKLLKERGGAIVCYSDDNDFYVVNDTNGLDFDNAIGDDELYKDGYVSIADIVQKNNNLDFTWDVYWGHDYNLVAKPKN